MSKTEINIYGGAIQVIPDATEVTQHIYAKDGKTVMVSNIKIIGKKKRDTRR